MSVKSHLSSNNNLASGRQVTSNEVNLILKSLNSKKTSGTDKTPTKVVKLASDFQSADDKYDISNFRPVNLLNCFSKVYENIIKCRLVDSMYNNISPFISAYRKNCNTQHVMISLERKMERKFRQKLCRWRGINGPIQSF